LRISICSGYDELAAEKGSWIMAQTVRPQSKIIAFLLLTFLFSSIFYYLILSSGSMQASGGIYVLGLMWCPGVAALIVQLVYHRSLRGLGWKWGKTRYQFLSYIIPFVYALIAYSIVWATGLGGFPNQEFISQIVSQYSPGAGSPYAVLALYLLVASTFGILLSSLTALGEEIGWRGLLAPELAKVTSFTKLLISSTNLGWLWWFPYSLSPICSGESETSFWGRIRDKSLF
jgi:uncharacterized protein